MKRQSDSYEIRRGHSVGNDVFEDMRFCELGETPNELDAAGMSRSRVWTQLTDELEISNVPRAHTHGIEYSGKSPRIPQCDEGLEGIV